jgi:prolyl-tRNA synthetase
VKDKFCDCVKKNMENNNIVLKGKQSRTDAVESYCYGQVVGSRIVASERKNMDMDKIVWEILGSEYCKCVEKSNNDEKVCSYLESKIIGYDKLSLSHKIFAKQFEIKAGDKKYKEQDNIGGAKYTVSYHDGKNKHDDGSDFYDIRIFHNKKERDDFISDLKNQGYKEA